MKTPTLLTILPLPFAVNGFVSAPKDLKSKQWTTSLATMSESDNDMTSSSQEKDTHDDMRISPELPTLQQIKSDPFMKQVAYGGILSSYLNGLDADLNDDVQLDIISELLMAQLQHKDGIRGFFVAYLTADTPNEIDNSDLDGKVKEFVVSKVLIDAMSRANNDVSNYNRDFLR